MAGGVRTPYLCPVVCVMALKINFAEVPRTPEVAVIYRPIFVFIACEEQGARNGEGKMQNKRYNLFNIPGRFF